MQPGVLFCQKCTVGNNGSEGRNDGSEVRNDGRSECEENDGSYGFQPFS
jgi:hypothetical protein